MPAAIIFGFEWVILGSRQVYFGFGLIILRPLGPALQMLSHPLRCRPSEAPSHAPCAAVLVPVPGVVQWFVPGGGRRCLRK